MKRKYLLLTVLWMLVACLASAQNLQQLLQQVEKAKTVKDKIYALDAIANYYTWTVGGHDEARAYGKQMISLAEESKQKELVAQAYILNGIRLVEGAPSTEREKELRGYFAQAIQIAKENNLPFYEASAYIGLSGIPFHIVWMDGDEALEWGKRALTLSTAIENDSLRALALIAVANGYKFKNNNIAAFHHFTEAVQLAENLQNPYLLAYCYRIFARFYVTLGDPDKALAYYSKAIESLKKKKKLNYRDLHWLYMTQWNTTWAYGDKKNFEKARESAYKVIELSKAYQLPSIYRTAPLNQLTSLYISEGKFEEAREFIIQNPDINSFYKNNDYESHLYSLKAKIFGNIGQPDSADYYYRLSLATIEKSVPVWSPGLHREYGNFLLERGQLPEAIQQLDTAKIRSQEFKDLGTLVASYQDLDSAYYQAGDINRAYQYSKLYHHYNDSLQQLGKDKELALLEVQNEQKKLEQAQQEKQAKAEYRNRIRTNSLLGGVAALLVVAGILYRNNYQKQKNNALLKQQKEKTERALLELQSTQAQLIQKEKMASLGELTAGIAHEIQNPLNFVNNFAEVSEELVEELKQEIIADHKDDALAISEDMRQNLKKIHHHGIRADSIVKNMLQHSRANSGEKQLTDFNKLADEYLRLSYHGMRAKDKHFNAQLTTDFDAQIGKVEVIPQELGRVLLNLYNNAFYATEQKQKIEQNGYLPEVKVSTKVVGDKVEIRVKDNGTGIQEAVKSKIFQPFFTTKPTGEGTGLGLSLSYDIITKGHGGEMKVESKEGEGAEFIITLPMNYKSW